MKKYANLKRLVALTLSLALVFALLVGCSSGTNSDNSNTGDSGSDSSSTSSSSSSSSGSNTENIGALAGDVDTSNDITGDTSNGFGGQGNFMTDSVKAYWSVSTLSPYTAVGYALGDPLVLEVYETLFTMDYNTAELVPLMAKSYTEVSEGVFDVEIFDYITDTAGNNITADDVVFSFETAKASGIYNAIMATLTTVEATGDYTVRFTFENMRKDVYKQVFTKIFVISQTAWEASPDEMATEAVGTGAYKVESFVSASETTIVARDDYWQTDDSVRNWISKQNAERISFEALADKTANAVALRTGDLDMTFTIADEDQQNFVDFSTKGAKEGYSILLMPNGAHRHLTFNVSENSPCSDINLRKAICYAIDVSGIIASCDRYIGTKINNFSAVPTASDYPDELKDSSDYWEYDEDLAKEYLEQSNYNGETIRILVNPSGWDAAGTVIGAYLDAIGIKYELLTYDSALYNDQHADESGELYDIDLCEINNFFAFWNASTTLDENNYSTGVSHLFIDDPELQELYDKVASVDSTDEDIMAYVDYVNENCYAYSLFYCNHVFYGSERVTKWSRVERMYVPGACEYSA